VGKLNLWRDSFQKLLHVVFTEVIPPRPKALAI
jgi:hypothetical protein